MSKLKALAEIEGRINAKIEPALAKKAWPKVVEVLNAELYAFKGTITDITKARSGGKVCQDAPKRGAGDAGEGRALLLVQTAVLQRSTKCSILADQRHSEGRGVVLQVPGRFRPRLLPRAA